MRCHCFTRRRIMVRVKALLKSHQKAGLEGACVSSYVILTAGARSHTWHLRLRECFCGASRQAQVVKQLEAAPQMLQRQTLTSQCDEFSMLRDVQLWLPCSPQIPRQHRTIP